MPSSSLSQHYQQIQGQTLTDLFNADRDRAQRFTLSIDGFTVDFSKNHITSEIITELCTVADKREMAAKIQALLNGETVNNTEQRPAHHSALREPASSNSKAPSEVQHTLKKMEQFVHRIHQQQHLGFSEKPIVDIVNIGIGGSDLGPRMAVKALTAFHQTQVKVHFVANIDGCDLEDTLKDLNPATTLFIVASKSFSTLETLNNALSARQWLLDQGCSNEQLQQHFIAISSNKTAVKEFGLADDKVFPIWDWVGGRYSLWSAIGLPIALALGMDNFKALLQGAHTMDQHFRTAPSQQNIPLIAALLHYWYSHFWGSHSQAILPYAQRLSLLPSFLQQLDMESLGKSVDRDGNPLEGPTGSVIWGAEGSNGQHSFHQLLHQGMHIIPVDFIAIKEPMCTNIDQHQQLLACCVSQSQALLKGRTLAEAKQQLKEEGLDEADIQRLAPHKVIPGNRPSSTIILQALTPSTLGKLIAFYEHKVYASSVLMGINAFDQWGVELGKQLSQPLYQALNKESVDPQWDSSTQSLLKKLIS